MTQNHAHTYYSHRQVKLEMADWGRRIDVVTWCFLGLNTCFWAISLGGVAALSRVYSGPSNNGQVINLLFLPAFAIV